MVATPYLHGNSEPCPACELRREVVARQVVRPLAPCNVCAGLGYLTFSDAEIVQRTVDEARRLYWPQFEQRVREHNRRDP